MVTNARDASRRKSSRKSLWKAASSFSCLEYAGGKVLVPKIDIGENGFLAFILDTEGTKVGLHSPKA